jgi:hypothetical protein
VNDWLSDAGHYRDVLLVVLGAVLATGYDQWKSWRDQRRRDASVLDAIRAEVAASRDVVKNNQALIATELKNLKLGIRMVNPPDPLLTDFWDLVKLDPPRSLASREHGLAKVREVARLTGQVNQMLRSREITWAMAFLPMSGGSPILDALEKLDELISTWQGKLLDALEALEPELA